MTIGHNSGDDEKAIYDRFCQLYRERLTNDEDLADLTQEAKGAKIEDIPELKALAREHVAPPEKSAKKAAKSAKIEALRERLGLA
jgi:hypothetical protein